MTLTEAKALANALKEHIGETMKPYDAPVVKFQVTPNESDHILTFFNFLSLNGNEENLLESYSDFNVCALFDELNFSGKVRWSPYEQFAFQNNL